MTDRLGKIVGIRFKRGCKVYDFDAGHFVLSMNDTVIVETEQGLALGEVVRTPHSGELPLVRPTDEAKGQCQGGVRSGKGQNHQPALKRVYRLATEDDLKQVEENAKQEKEAYHYCQSRIEARKMDMNLVTVECLFDRSKLTFYFTAEGRLDFRELVRDLVSRFRTRIEMRQIGVRHEAKLLGGLGSCGRELCCTCFLKDFEPVSVKMAKEQNLSLNPTKISGLCGRLMCCLTYEFESYRSLKKGLPKLGKRAVFDKGLEGKVIRQNVLKRKVTLLLRDGSEVSGTPEELHQIEPAEPPAERPPAPKPRKPSLPREQDNTPGPRSRGRGRRRKSRKASPRP